jgi:hypothetical protein
MARELTRQDNFQEKGTLLDLVAHTVLYIKAIRDLCLAREIGFNVLVQPFVRTRPQIAELRLILDYYSERLWNKCGISWYEGAPLFVAELVARIEGLPGVSVLDCQSMVKDEDFLDQVHLREGALHRIARGVDGIPGMPSSEHVLNVKSMLGPSQVTF